MIVQVLPLKDVLTARLRTDLQRRSQLNSIHYRKTFKLKQMFCVTEGNVFS